MSPARKTLVISGILAALLALNYVFEHGFGDFQINPYYARIINLIGINITLAVSLNLINGLAGQFSIGHAGFLAVGGYTATYLTVYHGAADYGALWQDRHRSDWRVHRHGSQPACRRCRGRRCGAARRHSVASPQGRLPRDCHARVQRNHSRDHSQHSRRREAPRALPTPFRLRTSSGFSRWRS